MTKCAFCPELGVATTSTTTTTEAFPFLCTQLGVNVSPSSTFTGSSFGGKNGGGPPSALCSNCHSLWEEVSVLYSNMQGLVNLMARRVQQFKKNIDNGNSKEGPNLRKRKPQPPPDDESMLSWWYPATLDSAPDRKKKKISKGSNPGVIEVNVSTVDVAINRVGHEEEIKSELEDDDIIGVVGEVVMELGDDGGVGDQEMGLEDFEILPEDGDDTEDDVRGDPSYDPVQATTRTTLSTSKVEFIKSQKGADCLIHEGFTYRKNDQRGETTYWICTKYKGAHCKARCKITNGIVEITNKEHNHTSDSSEIAVRKRIAKMKEQALNSQESPSQIIAQTVTSVSKSVAAKLPSASLLSKSINYARKKHRRF